jgi:HK97 family phage portal protein
MGRFGRAMTAFLAQQPQEPPGPADDFWYNTTPQMPGAGLRVTADGSLKVSAVFRSVTILADTFSTLPKGISSLKPDGSKIPAPTHPVHDIISLRPNTWQTPAEFWGMMGFHAALRGVGYAEIKPGRKGAVDQLIPLHPDRVKPEMAADNTLRFRVTNPHTGMQRILLQEEMFRIPGLTADGFNGLRTVEFAAEAIAILMAADQYAARVFSQKLNIGGFLSTSKSLSKDALTRLLQMLNDRFAGTSGMHRPMVLQEGMKFERASMDAKDAQLLEARKWQIAEIGRFWGIPAHMLGIDDQTNRSTVEEQSQNFVRYTIKPWCVKIEQAIRRDLITENRYYTADIELDDLERGNMQARAEYNSKALGAGGSPPWMTQDEVRVSEGLNPLNDGKSDKLAVATNPGQQQKPKALAELPPPAVETSVDAPAVGDPTPKQKVVRKEVATLRRLHVRHAESAESFHRAVHAFYGGFASEVSAKLEMSKDDAKVWCKARAKQICDATDVSAEIDKLESESGAQRAP